MGEPENRATDVYDGPNEPDLADVLLMLKRAIKLSIRTHCPAIVTAYDPATQTVSVSLGVQAVVKVTDPTKMPATMVSLKGTPPNADATLAPIQLVGIPVAWPATKAGYITFPLVTGDTGELHVHDRSIEKWLEKGIPTDPKLAFTHALKDSVFHPGLHSKIAPIATATDLTATVIEGITAVKIGALATSAIAKADALISAIDAAWAAATPGSSDGGAALKSSWLLEWNSVKASIAATKGKVE